MEAASFSPDFFREKRYSVQQDQAPEKKYQD
jgi:hypothetical protein